MSKINVSEELVKHVSELARLEIPQQQLSQYREHMHKVLGYFEQLSEVNTEGVSPLVNPVFEFSHSFVGKPFLQREDVVRDSLAPAELLKNAPEQQNQQFKLEAVIEEDS